MQNFEIIQNRIVLISCLFKAIDSIIKNKEYNSSVNEQVEKMKNLVRRIQFDEEKHFVAFSMDEDIKVSYARTSEDLFNPNKRVKVTFEKYVRRQLNDNSLSDAALNALNNEMIAFKEVLNVDKDIEYFSGKELVEFYNSLDSSCHSCMTSSCDCHKTAFYALNPEKVCAVYYKKTVRALLWTTDTGKRVLDRMYPENHKYIPTLKKWASSKNIAYRKIIDRGDNTNNYVELNNGENCKITMKCSYVYPYLDTFRDGWIKKDGTVVLSNNVNFGNAQFLSTTGEYSKFICCTNCGKRNTNYNYFNGEPYCQSCKKVEQKTCQCGFPINDPDSQLCIHCYNKQLASLIFNKCECSECQHNKTKSMKILREKKNVEYKGFNSVEQMVKKFVDVILTENKDKSLILSKFAQDACKGLNIDNKENAQDDVINVAS